MQQKERAALFLLRVGLGVFLLLWSCDKFAEPDTTVKIFQGFYKIPISGSAAHVIGAPHHLDDCELEAADQSL